MVKYEELKDVILEAMEECSSHKLCYGCKYDYLECNSSYHCMSLLVADNILKHYELKEKVNEPTT